jgi:hypothetical protein
VLISFTVRLLPLSLFVFRISRGCGTIFIDKNLANPISLQAWTICSIFEDIHFLSAFTVHLLEEKNETFIIMF